MSWRSWFLSLVKHFGYIEPVLPEELDLRSELAGARGRIRELEEELAEANIALKEIPHKRGDIPSPRDFIKQDKIDKAALMKAIGLDPRIKSEDVWLTTVADTHSMDALIDVDHTAMLIRLPQSFEPYRREDLVAGDIIVFEALGNTIMHRIFSIEENNSDDGYGRKYRTKGDHNLRRDPWIIRDGHVKYVLVAILY